MILHKDNEKCISKARIWKENEYWRARKDEQRLGRKGSNLSTSAEIGNHAQLLLKILKHWIENI
jgi:hypothetical protein